MNRPTNFAATLGLTLLTSAAHAQPASSPAGTAAPATDLATALPQPPASDLTSPTLFVVAYAHLDTQWRWTYPTSIREYLANTLKDNFALIEKYPHYTFNFSGSRRYQMMKEYYPTEYEKLKEYIAQGRWFPCGSSVDENDANVPSAESLVRHVLYGNRYFEREFGVSSQEYMLPDCFGFPAALPSVLAHCGVNGFSTQKLTWGSPIGIPFKVGVWEGMDGRSVVSALDPGSYGGEVREDLSKSDSWKTRINNNGKLSGVFADYHYYGTGDMGGAPTEKSVAMVEQAATATGPIRVISGPADWLFRTITPEMATKLPRYKGELLLTQHSAGSITSQSYMKRWNRKNEQLAQAAETAATTAWWLGAPYPAEQIEKAWTLVLGSQMHDILPGTSHPKAYEYSWNDEVLAGNLFSSILTDAASTVISQMDTRAEGTSIVVFNPLSFEREDVVEVNVLNPDLQLAAWTVTGPGASESTATVVEQKQGWVKLAFTARLPGFGWSAFSVKRTFTEKHGTDVPTVTEKSLESQHYKVVLNDDGDVASIFDKQLNKELLSAPARLALMYEKPAQWPAWNMDWTDRQKQPRSFVSGPPKFEVVERGFTRCAIRVTREHEGSKFIQTIRLAGGPAGDRVEFDTVIDWATRERSLKAVFPLTVSNPNATYDIQVGAIQRTTNNKDHYENPAHQWFDLSDAKGDYGVTIFNDSKFGSDKPDDSTLRLTLLYTPGVHNEYQDQATQDIGRHHILYAIAGHQGDKPTASAPSIAARLNQPLRAFEVPTHDGPLGRTFSLMSVQGSTVAATTVKKAEDSDDVIIRLREHSGSDARQVAITPAQPAMTAREVDGQEKPLGPVTLARGSLIADVPGYQLRAFAFKLSPTLSPASKPASTPIALPYNADLVSTNAKRDDGAVDADGRSYPAEQFPGTVNVGAIPFKLGPSANGERNAVLCRAQGIPLPSTPIERIDLLVAARDTDQTATFDIDGVKTEVTIPAWRGYIGQWDNRVWRGNVAEVAFNWPATFAGLEPGYIKNCEVAWFNSHYHTPKGDAHYQYCYLYRISLNISHAPNASGSAKVLYLPNNDSIMLFAATAIDGGPARVSPAAPLFDELDKRDTSAPNFTPVAGTFDDTISVTIEPGRYGRADAIRYTLDGKDPSATSPTFAAALLINQPTEIAAAVADITGKLGPITRIEYKVNDTTAPRITSAESAFAVPQVTVAFHEAVDKDSAANIANYSFDQPIKVTAASLDEAARRVTLTLDKPLDSGATYTLHIRNVKDTSPNHNAISDAAATIHAPKPVYQLGEVKPDQFGTSIKETPGLPVKGGQSWTLNMWVNIAKQPANRTIIAGFGRCEDDRVGIARYLAKFSGGAHFWSPNQDVPSKQQLELNKWQMLTATYDGVTLRLYRNGAKLGERPAELSDDENIIQIAPVDPWEKIRRFEGQIRELTIWDAALSEDSIKSLKESFKSP